jgi:hypothetical protein
LLPQENKDYNATPPESTIPIPIRIAMQLGSVTLPKPPMEINIIFININGKLDNICFTQLKSMT